MINNQALPPICGQDKDILQVRPAKNAYAGVSKIQFSDVRAAFGIALHMHQPTIPAGGGDLSSAALISNLKDMMDHQDIGDNHNAPVFLQCYSRISDIVRELVGQGKHPRVMLDYSGNLFWGIPQMGEGGVIDNLRRIAQDPRYYENVEWLGTMWSHAVASSTPVPDLRLHILAWRHHFAALFGKEALARVKGFSPPEMHLPIHPDVCYAYVKALKECGYEWLMVQEHTIENPDGSGIRNPHLPHTLVARNSLGETERITILIKTQGSDTKLVAQMQPLAEAHTLNRVDYAGGQVPPYALQIGDGENGGVMMNEFPPAFRLGFQDLGTSGVVGLNGSEYLEFLQGAGIDEKQFDEVQPLYQHRIWAVFEKPGPGAADKAIDAVKAQDGNFHLDKASWTNDRSWVSGYEGVLDPMNQLSAAFHEKYDDGNTDTADPKYQEALLYLLLSQTSCFRYWGEGAWTGYAKEICRRGFEALK